MLKKDIDFQNYFRKHWAKMVNPTEAKCLGVGSLPRQVGAPSPQQNTPREGGWFFAFRQAELSLRGRDGALWEGRFLATEWGLPACLLWFLSLPQNLDFLLGDLGRVFPLLWAQQPVYQKGAGSVRPLPTQTLHAQVAIWGSGYSSTKAASLSAKPLTNLHE